jgi:hypothetical protein
MNQFEWHIGERAKGYFLLFSWWRFAHDRRPAVKTN